MSLFASGLALGAGLSCVFGPHPWPVPMFCVAAACLLVHLKATRP